MDSIVEGLADIFAPTMRRRSRLSEYDRDVILARLNLYNQTPTWTYVIRTEPKPKPRPRPEPRPKGVLRAEDV